MSNQEEEFYGYIPTDNLPSFVKAVAKKYHFKPRWKECFKNAFMLGWMLDNEGHSVHYCEATCAMPEAGNMPYEHAWLRVDGVDINVSANGEPITVLTNSCFRMCVVPIKWLRLPKRMEKYAGLCLTGWQFRQEPDIQKWVSKVQSHQLTEHISWEFLEGYPDYTVCADAHGAGTSPDEVDLYWESKAEREQLTAGWVNVRDIMDATALRLSQAIALQGWEATDA